MDNRLIFLYRVEPFDQWDDGVGNENPGAGSPGVTA
jgi:hypothetical protein